MSNTGDETEARAEYFELLKYEFFVLRIEWRCYKSFFGTNEETVDLLNAISGSTANLLDRLMFERCLLGLRRLTDVSSVRNEKRRTVSVKGLVNFSDDNDKEIRKLIGSASKNCEFAKHWSDKRIAHADYLYRSGAERLSPASRLKVEESIASIAAVLKHFSLRYFQTTLLTMPVSEPRNERMFLKALYLGQVQIAEDVKRRKELISNRQYDEIKKLPSSGESLPDWLKRPDESPISSD